MINNKTSKSCSSDNAMPMQSQEESSPKLVQFSADITNIKTSNAGDIIIVSACPTSRALLATNNQVTSTSTKNVDAFVEQLRQGQDILWNLTVNYENKTKIAKVVGVKAANHDGNDALEFKLSTEEFEGRGATATAALDWDWNWPDTVQISMISSPRDTVYDQVAKNKNLSTLQAALEAAGFDFLLADGNAAYTLFAPTNDAFAALTSGTVDDLLKKRNKEKLVKLFKDHVVMGSYSAFDLMDIAHSRAPHLFTLNGKRLKVRLCKSKLYVGKSKVVVADVKADNGVVHLINEVLLA
jgi:uncharacterized surface protein with fasciclin (FAS1) repeats